MNAAGASIRIIPFTVREPIIVPMIDSPFEYSEIYHRITVLDNEPETFPFVKKKSEEHSIKKSEDFFTTLLTRIIHEFLIPSMPSLTGKAVAPQLPLPPPGAYALTYSNKAL
jgi:hypothetical protein